MTIERAVSRNLAEGLFQNFNFPDDFQIEHTSGFESEDRGSTVSFSKKLFYTVENDDGATTSAETGYFNVEIDLDTAEISDVYCILSNGGNLIGNLTGEGKEAAYQFADIERPSVVMSM